MAFLQYFAITAFFLAHIACSGIVTARRPPSNCDLPVKPGPCKGSFPRYYFDKKHGKCLRFVYGGCQGNQNNFKTLQECRAKCMKIRHRPSRASFCKMRPKHGPCNGDFRRFYFDHRRGQCATFVYGGCKGNRNNFKSLQECRRVCHLKKRVVKKPRLHHEPNHCKLPKETGPCRAAIPRYYFDAKTGRCELFIYGGCQGNKNNFKTLEECRGECPVVGNKEKSCSSAEPASSAGEKEKSKGDETPLYCTLKPKQGRCKALFIRYYFNKDTRKCQKFIYGGCGGNKNNFETKSRCMKVCGGHRKKSHHRNHQQAGIAQPFLLKMGLDTNATSTTAKP